MIGIYRIKNNLNGKVYIGQSVNIEKRWKEESKGKGVNAHLARAIKKYGIGSFTFSVLCECAVNELSELEMLIISETQSFISSRGYNKTLGGEGVRGNDETRRKISAAHKGKVLTEEHRRKLSEQKRGTKHPFYGKPRPLSTRQKLSQKKIGVPHPVSEETRRKMTEYRRTHLMYNVRSVVQTDRNGKTLCVYPSIAEASRATGIEATSISICVRKRRIGKKATAGKYIWDYAN